MTWRSVCWKPVFPGKTQCVPSSRVRRDFYWQNSRSWPLPSLIARSLALHKKTLVSAAAEGFGWSSKRNMPGTESGREWLVPRVKIKLLYNTPQGGVFLAEQLWLQNHSKRAMVGDAGHIMNPPPLSNTIPTPLSCSLGLRYGPSPNTKFCISPRQDNEI